MKIAAYCRVSTEKAEQKESLRHQKEFFAEYARRNGHVLVGLYADEGISGTSLKKREEFKRLLGDAQLGRFEMVVVKDVSRFARNTVDALQSVRKLKSLGINTLFVSGAMTAIGDGEFALTLFSAMAQEESNNLSKRVKWGKKINAEKGRVPPRVYGYDKVDNFTLAINEEEASVVRRIFSLYIDRGLGCRSISMELNREGDKTKFGHDWNARGVRRILVNPLYSGILINHKYEIQDFLTGTQVTMPQEEWFYHQRPEWAIVSREDFARAQEIMASRRKQYDSGEPFRAGRYSGKHTLSTLVKCAHCGRSFTRKTYTYKNTRVYWRCVTNDQYTAEKCPNHVILDERALLEALGKYFSEMIADRDAFAEKVLAGVLQERPALDPKAQHRALEAREKRLRQKRSRWQELYANDLLSMEELREKLAGLERELKALELRLEEPPPGNDHREDCRGEIDGFFAMQTVTNGDLRRLIDHISVSGDGNVRVILRKVGETAGVPMGV